MRRGSEGQKLKFGKLKWGNGGEVGSGQASVGSWGPGEKRWRATALQDAGAFTGAVEWRGGSGNAPVPGRFEEDGMVVGDGGQSKSKSGSSSLETVGKLNRETRQPREREG